RKLAKWQTPFPPSHRPGKIVPARSPSRGAELGLRGQDRLQQMAELRFLVRGEPALRRPRGAEVPAAGAHPRLDGTDVVRLAVAGPEILDGPQGAEQAQRLVVASGRQGRVQGQGQARAEVAGA